ncbi:oxygenase MpaB family protein [Cronobacter muytjensii]|uniref:oxygenase MpaB family protein n=1 Tax=Cronobacter muytjensii TaxID=413501 RepID=UPI003F62227B
MSLLSRFNHPYGRRRFTHHPIQHLGFQLRETRRAVTARVRQIHRQVKPDFSFFN